MDKIWLIIQREYLTRVKKRSFLIATFLTPIGLAALIAIVSFISSYRGDEQRSIAVIDKGGVVTGGLADDDRVRFNLTTAPIEEVKERVKAGGYDALLVIPAVPNIYAKSIQAEYYSDESLSLEVEGTIRERVSDYVREYKSAQLGLASKDLAALDFETYVEPEPLEEGGENASKMTGAIGAGIGAFMGFVMYLTIFLYGMMVMRSVMEEKTTRIVEVMISSVRPFQLMLGKIVGVGLVGLTQVALWAILIPLFVVGLQFFFGIEPPESQLTGAGGQAIDPEQAEDLIYLAMTELQNQNWWLIVPLFLFFFIGGYFLYASMFAAVGSVMGEDMGESNTLTIPITIPVIISFYIMIVVVREPNSTLAVWSSLFPLFSPIVMPARLAFDPPMWQIVLSVLILLATALGFVWLSARIYRTGILLYGKKVSFGELGKWMVRG